LSETRLPQHLSHHLWPVFFSLGGPRLFPGSFFEGGVLRSKGFLFFFFFLEPFFCGHPFFSSQDGHSHPFFPFLVFRLFAGVGCSFAVRFFCGEYFFPSFPSAFSFSPIVPFGKVLNRKRFFPPIFVLLCAPLGRPPLNCWAPAPPSTILNRHLPILFPLFFFGRRESLRCTVPYFLFFFSLIALFAHRTFPLSPP